MPALQSLIIAFLLIVDSLIKADSFPTYFINNSTLYEVVHATVLFLIRIAILPYVKNIRTIYYNYTPTHPHTPPPPPSPTHTHTHTHTTAPTHIYTCI